MTEVNLCPSTQFWSIWTVPLKNCSSPLYELPCKIWSLSLKKTAELPFDAPEPLPFWHPWNFFSHHLFGQSIQTLVQNVESVAQKLGELLHYVRKRRDVSIIYRTTLYSIDYTVQTLLFKVKSLDNILNSNIFINNNNKKT